MNREFVSRIFENDVRRDNWNVSLMDTMIDPSFGSEVTEWVVFILVVILLVLFYGGLIGIIFAMAVLLYRVNMRARHQRQIQDHIETIHAILEEGVSDIEEEIITPDEPPDYEPPPEYSDVLKYIRRVTCGNSQRESQSPAKDPKSSSTCTSSSNNSLSSMSFERSISCQTDLTESPPPPYENRIFPDIVITINVNGETDNAASTSRTTPEEHSLTQMATRTPRNIDMPCFSNNVVIDIDASLKKTLNLQEPKSTIFVENSLQENSVSNEDLVRSVSDPELMNIPKNSDDRDFLIQKKFVKRSFSADDVNN